MIMRLFVISLMISAAIIGFMYKNNRDIFIYINICNNNSTQSRAPAPGPSAGPHRVILVLIHLLHVLLSTVLFCLFDNILLLL